MEMNLHQKVLWFQLACCRGLASPSRFLARIIICFGGLIHSPFFLPSYSLSGATDILPFVSVRPGLAQSCQRQCWQLWRQPSESPFCSSLSRTYNIHYSLSSAALRWAPLLGDKLLLQLCLHLQFRQLNKGLHLLKWRHVVHSVNLGSSERLSALAKWIPYPNPGHTLSGAAGSWMAADWGPGWLPGSDKQ